MKYIIFTTRKEIKRNLKTSQNVKTARYVKGKKLLRYRQEFKKEKKGKKQITIDIYDLSMAFKYSLWALGKVANSHAGAGYQLGEGGGSSLGVVGRRRDLLSVVAAGRRRDPLVLWAGAGVGAGGAGSLAAELS